MTDTTIINWKCVLCEAAAESKLESDVTYHMTRVRRVERRDNGVKVKKEKEKKHLLGKMLDVISMLMGNWLITVTGQPASLMKVAASGGNTSNLHIHL